MLGSWTCNQSSKMRSIGIALESALENAVAGGRGIHCSAKIRLTNGRFFDCESTHSQQKSERDPRLSLVSKWVGEPTGQTKLRLFHFATPTPCNRSHLQSFLVYLRLSHILHLLTPWTLPGPHTLQQTCLHLALTSLRVRLPLKKLSRRQLSTTKTSLRPATTIPPHSQHQRERQLPRRQPLVIKESEETTPASQETVLSDR
jgi:hypothetical protein